MMPVFKPLSQDTLSVLSSSAATAPAPAVHDAGATPQDDLGDDDTFQPPCDNPYRRRGAEDAENPELVDVESDDSDTYGRPNGSMSAFEELDELGQWAASGGGGGANLTSRLRFRNNANVSHASGHSHLVEKMDRAEDRRREHIARDKLDRATVEQVLDPRTRMILFRLLSRSRLLSIDGCVSTGKEANVYFGTAPPGCVAVCSDASPAEPSQVVDVAVKVFKTAILSFKDRERYVAGEHRFRRGGYNRQSNRKMVQQWTEKEFRNLMRLREAGVPVPTPLVIKPPVLVMEFFGREGWPAPRLKDAQLSPERMTSAYSEVCILMRRMYCRAKLVHGDLSEYNILYHKRQIIIIDVSQSVEDDHPMALDFLRRDCANINDFFLRSGVEVVVSLRELFDFITAEEIDLEDNHARAVEDERAQESFHALLIVADDRTEEERRCIAADDVVFKQSFIPRTLDDIYQGDTDMHRTTSRDPEARTRYAELTGNVNKDQGTALDGCSANDSSTTLEAAASDAASDAASSKTDGWESDEARPTIEEARSLRRLNKKEVKAAARERRENKVPKHVKKRKDVVAKRKRHVKTK